MNTFKMNNNSGNVLIVVIMIATISSIIGMTAMNQLSQTMKRTGEKRVNVILLAIAEAGKEHAMSLLQSGQVNPVNGQSFIIAKNPSFGGGGYEVECAANSDGSSLILTSRASMNGLKVGIEATCMVDSGVKFQINSGAIIPAEEYKASVMCLGTGFQYSYNGTYYNAPIAIRLGIGAATIDPWGSFTSRTTGNINDANNPREYVFPDKYASGTPITVSAKVWKRTGSSTWAVENIISSSPATAYVKVLRSGDLVPQVNGFLNQASISSYVSNFVKNGKISIESNQSILLFELYSLNGSSADFQDVVMLVTLSKPGATTNQNSTTSTSTSKKNYRITDWREI